MSTGRPRAARRTGLVLPLLVAAVAMIMIVVLVATGGSREPAADAPVTHPPTTQALSPDTSAERSSASPANDVADPLAGLARRQPGDPMAMGEVDAPVVMIIYSDFQCPFCAEFATNTLPVLERKYVADGTLRVEWRDFPYLGPGSGTAAIAGRAAAEQGKFWEFHDAVYADQPATNNGKLNQAYVEHIATKLGLDLDTFRAEMKSDAVRRQIADDLQEGIDVGVNGTPAFVINGAPMFGALPTPEFERAIEKAAADAGR